MAKDDKTEKPRERGDRQYTHLLVQSRRERFRRAGIEATRVPVAIELSSLTSEQLDRIEAEDEIITRRLTAEQARGIAAGSLGDDDRVSKAELRQLLGVKDARIAQLETENAEYRRALTGDRPPKEGAPAPGGVPPLPSPGDGKNQLPSL